MLANSPFTVTDGNEARVDLVLRQPLRFSYVNHVVFLLTRFFQKLFPLDKKEAFISLIFTRRLGY